MNAVAALRRIEEGLVSRRQIATVDHEFAVYAAATLPANPPPAIQQGWDAGWAACMRSVTSLLSEVQTEALHEAARERAEWAAQVRPTSVPAQGDRQ